MIHIFTTGSTVEVEPFVLNVSDTLESFQEIEFLHRMKNMLLEPLKCYTRSAFSTTCKNGIVETCLPSDVS